MSQELQIPLLTDLIAKGGSQTSDIESAANIDYSDNENDELQFEADAEDPVATPSAADPQVSEEDDNDEADFHSVQELLIEEEIRLILDKHMDQAYEEIIRLINHRIS